MALPQVIAAVFVIFGIASAALWFTGWADRYITAPEAESDGAAQTTARRAVVRLLGA